jgi:type IV secretory pathway protease TraF
VVYNAKKAAYLLVIVVATLHSSLLLPSPLYSCATLTSHPLGHYALYNVSRRIKLGHLIPHNALGTTLATTLTWLPGYIATGEL